MIASKLDEFSDEQAVTATAISENIIDTGPGDVGPGEPLSIVGIVTEAFTAAGAGTLAVALETDGVEAFSSPEVIHTTPAIPKADLVAGYKFKIGTIPPGMERFLAMRYTVATGPMTAGKLTFRLALDRDANDPNF